MSDAAFYLSVINDPESTPLQKKHAQSQLNRIRLEQIAKKSSDSTDEG